MKPKKPKLINNPNSEINFREILIEIAMSSMLNEHYRLVLEDMIRDIHSWVGKYTNDEKKVKIDGLALLAAYLDMLRWGTGIGPQDYDHARALMYYYAKNTEELGMTLLEVAENRPGNGMSNYLSMTGHC